MSTHLLLVEDDPNLAFIVRDHLIAAGYTVTHAADGAEAANNFTDGDYSLCLIDIMLPKKDGITLVREIRQVDPEMPIIFLTAKSLQQDKLEGFRAGCDDYMTKPFSVEELLARIEAVLRRTNKTDPVGEGPITIGKFQFDYRRHTLKSDTEERKLSPKEAALLEILCRYRNRVLRREVALREVWRDDSYFASRSMDVYISKLRKYLQADPNVSIVAIHGEGFRLVVD